MTGQHTQQGGRMSRAGRGAAITTLQPDESLLRVQKEGSLGHPALWVAGAPRGGGVPAQPGGSLVLFEEGPELRLKAAARPACGTSRREFQLALPSEGGGSITVRTWSQAHLWRTCCHSPVIPGNLLVFRES